MVNIDEVVLTDFVSAELSGRPGPAPAADITDVRFRVRQTDLAHPINTANYRASQIFHVVGQIHTRDGSIGTGHAFCFTRPYAEVICEMSQSLARAEFTDANVSDPVALWKQAYGSLAFLGHAGISMIALSILDTAVWDALGHVRDLPMVDMLGGGHRSIEAYGSDRLWLGDGPKEIAAGVKDMADAGFRSVKLRLGSPRLDTDVQRVEAVLSNLPAGLSLLVDANQGWESRQAVDSAARLSKFDLSWLEEPVRAVDWEGFAAVKARVPGLRIAGGESWYGPAESLRALEVSNIDVFMPDLQRMGGVTPWLICAKEAIARGRAVSPHLFPEVSYSLMAGLGVQERMEHVSWNDDLFAARPALEGGAIRPGAGPGLGIRLAPGVMDG